MVQRNMSRRKDRRLSQLHGETWQSLCGSLLLLLLGVGEFWFHGRHCCKLCSGITTHRFPVFLGSWFLKVSMQQKSYVKLARVLSPCWWSSVQESLSQSPVTGEKNKPTSRPRFSGFLYLRATGTNGWEAIEETGMQWEGEWEPW